MKKDFWKPLLLAAALVAVIVYFEYYLRDQRANLPCESFASYRLDQIPARCLKHFTESR